MQTYDRIKRRLGGPSELAAEVGFFDGADAVKLLLCAVELEGAFDVVETLGHVGVIAEPLVAQAALELEPSDVVVGGIQFGG